LLERLGHLVQEIGDRKQTKLLVNNEITISVTNAHWFYKTLRGKQRWVLKRSIVHQSDLLMIVRPAETASEPVTYFFVPDLTSDVAQQLLVDRNHLEIESFRGGTLEPLQSLFAREVLAEMRPMRILEPVPTRVKTPKTPNFSHQRLKRKAPHAKMLLRAFQRYSASMRAFAEKSHRIATRQRALEACLQELVHDKSLVKMLKREGLDSMPWLTADRIYL
jgi:hypothetical protein